MAQLNVFWTSHPFNEEDQTVGSVRGTRTGVLTDEHAAADDDMPVIVEDLTQRVYEPGELPPDAVIYVEGPEDELPPLAATAKLAGFDIRPGNEFKDPEGEPGSVGTVDEFENEPEDEPDPADEPEA